MSEQLQITPEQFAYIRKQTVGKLITLNNKMYILSSVTESIAGHRFVLTSLTDDSTDCIAFYPNMDTICLLGLNMDNVALDAPAEQLSHLILGATNPIIPLIFASMEGEGPILWNFPCQIRIVDREDSDNHSKVDIEVYPITSKYNLVVRRRDDLPDVNPGDIFRF